jgi:nucleotide-binding universal stress UspA family protein
VAAVFDGWGPKVSKRIRSGSPAAEIIKAAKQYDAGLVVVAAGGRGITDVVLIGSTAQRVQHYAPCPVLVVRPAPRPKKTARQKA